jgi:hypothetical protein
MNRYNGVARVKTFTILRAATVRESDRFVDKHRFFSQGIRFLTGAARLKK